MGQPVRTVRVFFYGSFINLKVLGEVGLRPERVETARLRNFEIRIRPLANLVPSPDDCVYGIVCDATPSELEGLYSQDWVGAYFPEAVLVESRDGKWEPALTYIAPGPKESPAADDYIDRILGPARDYSFPQWYLDKLESFRTPRQ